MTTTDRVRAYLAKLPPAIAGQGGHAATFRAGCRLVEFGLDQTTAGCLLAEWNQSHCQPPWSEAELRHKLADAYRQTSPQVRFTTLAPARNGATNWHQSRSSPTSKRPALPLLRPGSAEDFSRLAELRSLAREGIALASVRGLLRFGRFRDHAAWFVLDASGRVAQARRMDGQPWAEGVKAWTLAGSQGAWPVGIGEAAPFPVLGLVEGGPDLLAAFAFIVAEGREAECGAVAMLGGCASIHLDALPQFAGKRVRLFPHLDDTGKHAANRWAEQLANAGATVDAFSLAGLRRTDDVPLKDLCDLAAIQADDFEVDRSLWTIFP